MVSHGMAITYLESKTDGYPNILTEGRGWLSLEKRSSDGSFGDIMKKYYKKQGHEKIFHSRSCSVNNIGEMLIGLHGHGNEIFRGNTLVVYKIHDWEEKICK